MDTRVRGARDQERAADGDAGDGARVHLEKAVKMERGGGAVGEG